jgi:hypothetical protein
VMLMIQGTEFIWGQEVASNDVQWRPPPHAYEGQSTAQSIAMRR